MIASSGSHGFLPTGVGGRALAENRLCIQEAYPEWDGAIGAFQATVAGVDGDSLLGDLPAIVRDLERIDSAWTAWQVQHP